MSSTDRARTHASPESAHTRPTERSGEQKALEERRSFARRTESLFQGLEDGFLNDSGDEIDEKAAVWIAKQRKGLKSAIEKDDLSSVPMGPLLVLAATQGASARESLANPHFSAEDRPEAETRAKQAEEFFSRGAALALGSEETVSLSGISVKLGSMVRSLDALKTPGLPASARQALENIRASASKLAKEDPTKLLDQIQALKSIDSLNGEIMEYNQRVLLPGLAEASSPTIERDLLWDAQRLAKALYELTLIERTLQEAIPKGVPAAKAERVVVEDLRKKINPDASRKTEAAVERERLIGEVMENGRFQVSTSILLGKNGAGFQELDDTKPFTGKYNNRNIFFHGIDTSVWFKPGESYRSKREFTKRGVSEMVRLEPLMVAKLRQEEKTVSAGGVLGFFGVTKQETKPVEYQEPVQDITTIIPGHRMHEPAMRVTYVTTNDEYQDYSGRGGNYLSVGMVLPQSVANKFIELGKRDPTIFRALAEKIATERTGIITPEMWKTGQGNHVRNRDDKNYVPPEEQGGYRIRPPYEKWKADQGGVEKILIQDLTKPGSTTMFREEDVVTFP